MPGVVDPTRVQVMDALRASSGRFIDLVASLDPSDAARPVPRLDWNVGETVAHVLTVVRRGFADRRRSASAATTADLNQLVLDETPERDLGALASMLREDVHTALDLVFPKIDDDRVFPFHGGVQTTMTPALRIVLGEYVIHGYDVAAATDRPWTITEAEALLLVPGELMSAWVRPDAPQHAYELRLGIVPPIRFDVGPGRLQVTQGTGGDVITMDPVPFALAFYGREVPDDDAVWRFLSNFVPS
ncbi:MAG: hypothetical protein QOG87_415 [Actinomycetota bacterium]